jgi:hypothetical protein
MVRCIKYSNTKLYFVGLILYFLKVFHMIILYINLSFLKQTSNLKDQSFICHHTFPMRIWSHQVQVRKKYCFFVSFIYLNYTIFKAVVWFKGANSPEILVAGRKQGAIKSKKTGRYSYKTRYSDIFFSSITSFLLVDSRKNCAI